MMGATVIYLCLAFVTSVVCLAAYGLDKRRAVNDGRRTPGQTSHILALLAALGRPVTGVKVSRGHARRMYA